jgi:hypothetical protein
MTITFLAPDGVAITAQQERQAKAALFVAAMAARSVAAQASALTPPPRPRGDDDDMDAEALLGDDRPRRDHPPGHVRVVHGRRRHRPVTASDVTYDRKDIVYVQINDSSAGDGSGALTANVYYLAGTPSATPYRARPSRPVVPARHHHVPKTGGGSPTVTQ